MIYNLTKFLIILIVVVLTFLSDLAVNHQMPSFFLLNNGWNRIDSLQTIHCNKKYYKTLSDHVLHKICGQMVTLTSEGMQ
jgi:hypothetical protein